MSDLDRLWPLAGRWNVTMSMPSGETYSGWATFEWLGAFLVWSSGGEHPQAPETLTIIGPDADGDRSCSTTSTRAACSASTRSTCATAP